MSAGRPLAEARSGSQHAVLKAETAARPSVAGAKTASHSAREAVAMKAPQPKPIDYEKLKQEASDVLAEFGLTVSDVVRMTLTRVAKDRAVPLELKVPSGDTRAAMRESYALMKKHNARFSNAKAVFDAIEKDAGKR